MNAEPGGVVAGVLVLVAGLHVLWGLGLFWPARDAGHLARMVIGGRDARDLPPPVACLGVAAALLLAAALVWLAPEGAPLVRLGAGAVGGVLLLRGAGGFFMPLLAPQFGTQPFARLNTWAYSPLCLLLGGVVLVSLV
ncbi:DUF3995 domain-containing protein [Deinococcus sp. HMF7604]|uniref:DUF3995 domain-containing protein n=1 Tax=Deinococcus betulae TaxID=2873312 RepID=UPI001CCB9D03|nr:DUF3995 domain-containing protein [Deinococcus betulae]MBZ9752471.1 DUF3995 domain-containing protein [Deinococcus betulae]